MAKKGGVFFPLYQREAMFITFNAVNNIFALRLFVGGVNALSGVPWNSSRPQKKQGYILVPPQVRVDGSSLGNGWGKRYDRCRFSDSFLRCLGKHLHLYG
ncbi:hypothetical protein AK830_g4071 [Neonectria ditissima]|uniref:Uncharacterized protein n=1 Tax=Neonectria ditissima TaxID=78410 RepID=A0A0P7BGT5_9HYPO|nr:hypothetical protein AK830_g4071 [Neonectria ditissima]